MAAKILVIEDQAVNMKLFVDILEIKGYEVFQAQDAEEGIGKARAHDPDLIIMDIQLPGKDGITATKEMKRCNALKHIPILGVTAHAMDGDREKILASGCDGYLSKPVQYKELLRLIEDMLNSCLTKELRNT